MYDIVFVNTVIYVPQVRTLQTVGGNDAANIISNVLKKLLKDSFAEKFSYLGLRSKQNFNALKLCSIVKSKYFKLLQVPGRDFFSKFDEKYKH